MCNALCVKGRPARSAVQPSHPCLEARQIPWLRLIVGRTGEPVEPVHSTGSNRWFCDEKWASPVHRTGSNRWFRTSQPTKDQRTDNRLEPVRTGSNRCEPVRAGVFWSFRAPNRFTVQVRTGEPRAPLWNRILINCWICIPIPVRKD